MKFQASRFSASGRKMPLEPHRSGACRSCQPMHVLSFGEGRSCVVCCCLAYGTLLARCFVLFRSPARLVCEKVSVPTCTATHVVCKCLVNLDVLCASEASNARDLFEWRFDNDVCFVPRALLQRRVTLRPQQERTPGECPPFPSPNGVCKFSVL
jgi:hypothetical protein